ncbi:hypothetical protein [Nocardia gamkensis]|uniref:hypothetical protein n=1 Tax=Nocardia gamkensis TaxID=352869 RepID=UPI0037C7931A
MTARDFRHDTPIDRSTSAYTLPKTSSYIRIQIGDDWLPTAVNLSTGWKKAFDATQYAESIMDSYRYFVLERAIRMIESGRQGSPTLPSLREAAPTLLRARTYDEYLNTLEQLMGSATYSAHGQGCNAFDEPAITVEANHAGLTRIAIDPDWALSADSFTIAYDITDCCNQIRALKPQITADAYLDSESDGQLAERLVDHMKQLLRSDLG